MHDEIDGTNDQFSRRRILAGTDGPGVFGAFRGMTDGAPERGIGAFPDDAASETEAGSDGSGTSDEGSYGTSRGDDRTDTGGSDETDGPEDGHSDAGGARKRNGSDPDRSERGI